MKDAKIQTDQQGNLKQDAAGNFITRVMRDKAGNIVPTGQTGGKYTDEYNCSDFTTQPEAQAFTIKPAGLREMLTDLMLIKTVFPARIYPKGINQAQLPSYDSRTEFTPFGLYRDKTQTLRICFFRGIYALAAFHLFHHFVHGQNNGDIDHGCNYQE